MSKCFGYADDYKLTGTNPVILQIDVHRIPKWWTQVFKKTKIEYSVLGLRKPNFKPKIIPFEKYHNVENCKRGPFEIF